MPIDVAYLAEKDGEPPFIQPPKEMERRPTVIGSGGITATQSEDGDVALSFDGPTQQALSLLEESAPSAADPTRHMGFKCRFFVHPENGPSVNIQRGYVSSVYYGDAGWVGEQFEVQEEDVTLTNPGYLYLNFPVIWVDGTDPVPGANLFPQRIFSSPAVVIEGTNYYFTVVESTSYLRHDTHDNPASYYVTSAAPMGNTSTRMRFLIATTKVAGIQQIHLGGITLPQSFEGNITSFEVA